MVFRSFWMKARTVRMSLDSRTGAATFDSTRSSAGALETWLAKRKSFFDDRRSGPVLIDRYNAISGEASFTGAGELK